MLKKFVKPLTALVLIIIAVVWIVFLEKQNKPDVSLDPDKIVIDITLPPAVTTPIPSPKPTREPAPTSTPTPIPTPTGIPEPTIIFEYCTTKTSDDIEIFNGPSTSYSVCGTLKGFSAAKILERGDEWIKIKTDSITGYVEKVNLDLDDSAVKTFREMGALQIKITGNGVNIRSEANTTCDVVGKADVNSYYDYSPENDTDEFFAIMYENKLAFVSKQYSKFELK